MEFGNSEVDPKVGGPVLTESTGGEPHAEVTLQTFMVLSGSIPGPWLRHARMFAPNGPRLRYAGLGMVKMLHPTSVERNQA